MVLKGLNLELSQPIQKISPYGWAVVIFQWRFNIRGVF